MGLSSEIESGLRSVRLSKHLTLRDVEVKSLQIAERWGNPGYRISASWLSRVESGVRQFSASKLVVLAVVYQLNPDEMLSLRLHRDDSFTPDESDHARPGTPAEDFTWNGQENGWKLDQVMSQPVPTDTTLLPPERHLPSHVRVGIMGLNDNALSPVVSPGSLLFVNTHKRAIGVRTERDTGQRPIYLLYTRSGFLCGWCDLDRCGEWLTLIPHHASTATVRRWKVKSQVEVVGRVTAALQRFNDTL